MARFDVFSIDGQAAQVLDVQPDLFADLHTRIVVPLVAVTDHRRELMPRLRPTLRIGATDYVMSTTEMAAIPCSRLGKPVANLEDQEKLIVDAIDFLLHGFRGAHR